MRGEEVADIRRHAWQRSYSKRESVGRHGTGSAADLVGKNVGMPITDVPIHEKVPRAAAMPAHVAKVTDGYTKMLRDFGGRK